MIDELTRKSYAENAVNLLAASSLFKDSQHIACYLASPEEFDCRSIMENIWDKNKNCYLPILSHENSLEFAIYKNLDELKLNRYKILEPAHPKLFATEKLDLVLLPLVGFDLKGNRLGMGAGYYDRTFAFRKNPSITKPFLLGIGYECQKLENISSDDWDVKLDGILTEKKLLIIS